MGKPMLTAYIHGLTQVRTLQTTRTWAEKLEKETAAISVRLPLIYLSILQLLLYLLATIHCQCISR